MTESDLEALDRAHQLFAGSSRQPVLDAPYRGLPSRNPTLNTVAGHDNYQSLVSRSHQVLLSAARTDAAAAGIMTGAHRDRADARELTKNVLDEARADAAVAPTTPMAQREAMRRRVARLRAQRAHVLTARLRARRHAAALRALRYRMLHHRGPRLAGLRLPSASSRAGIAVRAALSRLGRPYVWGATGPDQFDCSGLVQWSYARAGIHLDRTTYQQINDGIPVPRSQVRPGDLVFPHAGHVQMAIGNNLVVEAPYSGASVRISQLGSNVAIRRPIG
ncbi:C40 family peptidase [Mycobacterium sp. Aquia_216]|uniref:C40 family peptidase n=1 Tax=Mycobacterium sp. Aquia_216 TaxID=2991729 RepID=UPI00227B4BD8|nr:C40 family peptidase [Mycobacterium sp. Aquia_216]WAJ45248.1 C40 family peptidase [Mycobacterium sp. Aquia_216]